MLTAERLARAQTAPAKAPFALAPPLEADVVDVRGSRVAAPVGSRDGAVAVSTIEREQLAGPGLKVTDVLRTMPGVQVSESGGFGAPATASVRGATAQQTPVYLAGVRINDDVGGVADLSSVPLWLLQRIEVYRGHAPLEADRLGIGGAMFFDPRRPSRTEVGGGMLLGSYGARGAFAFAGLGGRSGSALIGVASNAATNDYPYRDDRGTLFDPGDDRTERRTNADVETLDAWGLGSLRLGCDRSLSVVVNVFHRDQGVPRLALLPSRAARALTNRYLVAATTSLPIAPRIELVLRTTGLLARSVYFDPLRELSLYAERTKVLGARAEQSASMPMALAESLTLRPSVSVAVERIVRDEDTTQATRGRRLFSRGSLGLEWTPHDLLLVRAVGAAECHGTDAASHSLCDLPAQSGRLSAAYGDRALQALGSLGRYVRIPTLGEIAGVSEVVRGNKDLRVESAWSGELGCRGEASPRGWVDGSFLEVFAFGRVVDDLIAYQRTAQGYVVPYNVGRARVVGGEASGALRMARRVLVGGGVSLLDARDTSPERTTVNDLLPFRARMVASSRLRLESGRLKLGPLKHASLELRHTHQASRYADAAGLVLLAAQNVADVEAALRLDDDRITVRLRASNVFDTTRFDIVGFPLPGTTLFTSLEVVL